MKIMMRAAAAVALIACSAVSAEMGAPMERQGTPPGDPTPFWVAEKLDRADILRHVLEGVKSARWLEEKVAAAGDAELGAWVRAANELAADPRFRADNEQLRDWVWEWSVQRFPEIERRWVRDVSHQGLRIHQDHSLIDRERIPSPQVGYHRVDGARGMQVAVRAQSLDLARLMPSEARMLHGIPPVGPDGRDVSVCRLFDGKNPVYLEFSDSEAQMIVGVHAGHADLRGACLRGELERSYWERRHGDFVNERWHRIEPSVEELFPIVNKN